MQYIRVCACINKAAIRHNFKEIKKSVPDNVKIMSVIKADGYGHGALTMAKELENGSDYFAVAIIEEALQLRNGGVTIPIMLLGYSNPQYFEEAVKNDITLTILSVEDARKLSAIATKMGKTAKIHVPVDTGMSRIGFPPTDEGAGKISEIASLEGINLEGVFTHFATSDEKDKEFTRVQASRFADFRSKLEERNVNIEIYHCANSGAIIQHSEFSFDMVRPGIILYGLKPSEDVCENTLDLKPVMELESRVAFIKTINKGDSVSYGRTFVADREMKIATIPVGYADGYPRLLSNKGRVIINGKYAPIVGRVCMDQFMVDVTGIDVSVGDKVILMGRCGDLFIGADEIAHHAQTINYEIVCGIGKRVPCVVRDENL